MYWKAVNLKYENDTHVRVGILLFQKLTDENPVLCILGVLMSSEAKRKWLKPMKIKRWLLYNPSSHSYATHHLRRTIWKESYKVTVFGNPELLYGFDQDIIIKKFPGMTLTWDEKKRKESRF